MTKRLITADHVLTGFTAAGEAEIIEDGAILTDGDRIVAIGSSRSERCRTCDAMPPARRRRAGAGAWPFPAL